ncbi:hypothetical protein CDEST_04547 [Colletotrichum destructivum]|uniref:Uncharacterized protein n=1 Tax=Colletotrichum destructivum TaxID=34406 RepID=A0AAX4I833_9PEZI|nr:hypothetical protein CDEST_04547 [Colletotrichum destructivum]
MDPFNLGPDQSRASVKLQILRYTADCWQGFNAVLLGPCTRAFLLTTDWIMSGRSLTPSVLVGESCPLRRRSSPELGRHLSATTSVVQ